jgi:uncharacterized protein YkwD
VGLWESLFDWFRRRPQPPPVPPPAPADLGPRMLAAVNLYRARAGLPPLRPDARLDAAAQKGASLCRAAGRLDHQAGGTDPWRRMRGAGYAYALASENLARGQATPEQAVDDWAADPPHRANLLGSYQDLGVGYDGGYWCADFAAPATP